MSSPDVSSTSSPESAAPPAAPPLGPRPAKPRSQQTVRDLVLSMLVVGGFVAFLYIVVLRPAPDPVRVVDVPSAVFVAKSAEAFPIPVPTGLPADWRATSARFTMGPVEGTGQWYNGYLNPDDEFVAVIAQDHSLDEFVAEQTRSGTAEGQMTIAGRVWEKFYAADVKQWSLVTTTPDETIIVTGTVPYDELAAFAATLQPA